MKTLFFLSLLFALTACATGPQTPEADLVRLGSPEALRLSLEQRLFKDPKDHQAHYQMAWVLEQSREFEGAAQAIERAVVLEPQSASYRLLAGQVQYQMGDYFQAVNLLSAALKLDNRLLEAYYFLALSLEATGRSEEALSQLKLALEIEPLYFDARLAKVRIAMTLPENAPDLASLTLELEAALKIKPNSVEGTLLLAQLYGGQGASYKARLILEDWLKRFGNQDRVLLALARLELSEGRPEVAQKTLARQKESSAASRVLLLKIGRHQSPPAVLLGQVEKELTLEPDSEELYLYQGELYLELGRPEEAERCLQRALKINPRDAQAHLLIARAYLEEADYAGEEMALAKARSLAPSSLEIRLAYLASLIRQGLWDEAQTEVQRGGTDQDHRGILLIKAYLAEMKGDYGTAEALLTRVLKKGSDPQAELAMARLELSRGLFDTGLGRAQRLLKERPTDFEVKLVLAKGYLLTGKHQELETILNPLLDQRRGEGRAHLLLAQSKIRRGQVAQAAETLRQALRTWPRQPDLVQAYTLALGLLGQYAQAIPLLEEMQRFRHRYNQLFGFRLWEYYFKAGQKERFNQFPLPQ